MRIISGALKGKRFFPPKKFPSRPTTDLAKESLFNILDNRVYFEKLEVLDLFAGTGNVSLEFLSRGVGKLISIDSHFVSNRFQEKLKRELDLKNWLIYKQDAIKYLENATGQFDIIFADPPFDFKDTNNLPALIFDKNLLVDDGILVVEHGQETNMSHCVNYKLTRNYGGVYFSFFEKD
ncbi:RsmD family RNA methyltransferase [Crocinitomix catalasitica]|uniref:RsmD family RNA methyltransferase n=1 Tax=Crocinitomix catalasitica TaxID=184607 RepID=UPI000485F801|nr:RsmD family RNA methyltransferase [Crocinitomix catalasitica]